MIGFLPVLAAAAALHTVDVPGTLGAKVQKATAKTGLAVEIPDSFKTEFDKLYADLRTEKGLYELDLGAAPKCFGGGACGVAAFIGQAKGSYFGKQKINLHHGIVGRFSPTTCGANCSSPTIEYRDGGVLYTVAIKGLPGKEKAALKAVVNQAIDAGPR